MPQTSEVTHRLCVLSKCHRYCYGGVIAVLETALLVVAVVAWGVRNNVLRSLTSITRHSQRIAKGDLSAPV